MERRRRRRTEKGGGGGGSSMVEKLKQGVLLKRVVGPSTPPPSWRLELPSPSSSSMHGNEEFLNFLPTISARKLCANLWEILPHQHTPPATRLRRRRRHRRAQKPLAEPPHNSSDQPESASSSLRRHVAASPVQRRRSNDSYRYTAEAAPNSRAATPTSSADLEGMIGESCHDGATSAELLKVLNRIWSLEEQHASNASAVKALRVELDHSRAWMEELLREKQTNRREMENLMADRLVRKNKEEGRVKAAVRSAKEELEDERRLRRHSESLRRKLSQELSEAKSCLRSLEREREARVLLENLCDEFARKVRDFEREARSLRRKPAAGEGRDDSSGADRLLLGISEAWIEQRTQMRTSQSGNDLTDRGSVVDRLGFHIETFLRYRNCGDPTSSPKGLGEMGAGGVRRALRMNSCHSYDDDNQVIGNSSLSSEGDRVHPEASVCREEDPCVAAGSPAKPQRSKSIASEHTLMAKLLRARLEGKKSLSGSRRSAS